MIVLDKDFIVACDVDDTLVMWPANKQIKKEWIRAKTIIKIHHGLCLYELKPHLAHIQLLRKHKAEGHTIMVWSAGGFAWAKTVVEALGLTDIVDLVISKPSIYVDDLKADEFMDHCYIKPD